MSELQVIDYSNWNGLDAVQAHATQAAGAIIRYSTEDYTKHHIAMRQARDAQQLYGWHAGYGWAYFNMPPTAEAMDWDAVRQDIGFAPTFFAIDCESEGGAAGPPPASPEAGRDWLKAALTQLFNVGYTRLGIYTRRTWWNTYMSGVNIQDCKPDNYPGALFLWDAFYDNDPDADPVGYGGESGTPAISQWRGDPLDLNTMQDWLIAPDAPVVDPMAEVARLISLLGYLQGDVADALQREFDTVFVDLLKAKRLNRKKLLSASPPIYAALNTLRTAK